MAKFKNDEGQELGLDDILQDAEYQAEFDKKVAKAIEKSKTDINAEVQKKLDAALAGREEEIRKNIQEEMQAKQKEAEENAKLSEAEKYQKTIDQLKQSNMAMQSRLDIIDRQAKIENYVKEKGYDKRILGLVNAASMKDSEIEDRVDAVNATFTESVSTALNEKLKEDPDKLLGKKGKDGGPVFDFGFQPIKPN